MQQPALAPAPHTHMSPQEAANSAEQSLYPSGSWQSPPAAASIQLPSGTTTTANPQPVDPALTQFAMAALRAHLLQNLNSSQPPTPGGDGKPGASASPDMNIDPAISGVGATLQQQPQQLVIQQQPQIQPQQPPTPQTMQMSVSPTLPQSIPMDGQSQSHSGAEESGDQPKPRGGKRELSTSKRAAQNRAAQRAFRQRKEGYIKKLEQQVSDYQAMQERYKQVEQQNYELRDYIISLQSRVIEIQGEDALPPPPISLVHTPIPLIEMSNGNPAASVTQQPQQAGTLVAAPTANMGMAQGPATTTAEATVGQKRMHDDTSDSALLQSIAQAAGTATPTTAGNGYIPPMTAQPQTPRAAGRKSASPASKRVKGETAQKTETATVNVS